jgi:hypothetical protein
METRKEKIEKAWRNYYSISNSEGVRCGNMICHKCKEKIKGNYLIQERSNFMLRGNEHDETYLFHRKCSETNGKWAEFDKNQKEYKEAQIIRESQIEEVKSLIAKYKLDADDLFEIDYHY